MIDYEELYYMHFPAFEHGHNAYCNDNVRQEKSVAGSFLMGLFILLLWPHTTGKSMKASEGREL